MDDHTFDKKFADKLNQVGDYEFDEVEWEKVSNRLKTSPRLPWLTLIIASFLLALLGSNLWMGYQLHTLHQQYDELKTSTIAVVPSSESNTESAIVVDTLYKHVVVHQYDTIHHTVIYHQGQQNEDKRDISISESDAKINRSQRLEMQNVNEVNEAVQPLDSSQSTDVDNFQNRKESILDISKDDTTHPAYSDSLEDSIQNDLKDLDTLQTEAKILEKKLDKKEKEETKEKRPSIKVGVATNLPFLAYPAISNSGGVGIGLRTEVTLTPQVSLFAHGNYSSIQYSVNHFNEGLGISNVNGSPAYQQDELVEAAVKQQILQYGLGIRYVFIIHARIKPYVSLAYFHEQTLERQLDYSYRDITNDKLYLINVSEERNSLFPHIIDAEVGGTYPLSHHLLLQAGGYFNRKISQERIIRPDQFGLRTILYYNFKK